MLFPVLFIFLSHLDTFLEMSWYGLPMAVGLFFLILVWPVYRNYYRFSLFIYEVSRNENLLIIHYLDFNEEKTLQVDIKQMSLEQRKVSRSGIQKGEDFQLLFLQDGVPILKVYDYPSFTQTYYLEELTRILEGQGVRVETTEI